jgi:glucosamine--fructose-6-phosphate aminotransferase (isomerizing)
VALLAGLWADHDELVQNLSNVPQLIQTTLQLDATIATSCERYRYIQECAVLARGLNQCTALEAALKMTETSYLVAKPYSGADFLHGPVAMVSDGFPCFLFAPDGAAHPSMLELAKTLKARGAEMVIIERDPEILSPGQLWAYHLARNRGYNPDKPRGLSKVTLTR